MKQYFLLLFSLIGLQGFAQILNPVKWNYRSKKISERSYEIHLTATIEKGWHLFSQTQPADAIALPTSIQFQKNIHLNFIGKPKEAGELKKIKEPTLGIEQWQYANKVDFVQLVQVRSKNVKLKIGVKGTIELQTCTDEKCLPPKTIEFSIEIK